MRAIVHRQRFVLAAAAASGALLLAACGTPGSSPPATTSSATSPAVVTLKPGTVLVSDGSATVKIGDQSVTFPTTVTDASFSPDGSRIAFVDGDGNIATAHPDGTGMVVLTAKKEGVQRSAPAWAGTDIIFTYRAAGEQPAIYVVAANGSGMTNSYRDEEVPFGYADGPEGGNTAPTASVEVGDGAEIGYQHQGASGPEVWVVDTNQRSPYDRKVAMGSWGELSPDGKRLAFVGSNGQVSVVSTVDDKAAPVQVTFGVASPAQLAWSADGAQLAFGTANGVQSVSATVAKGATSNPTTQLSTSPGVPSFVPPSRNELLRLGADPVAASLAASKRRWPTMTEYFESEGDRARGAVLVGTKGAGATIAALGAMPIRAFSGPLFVNAGASLDPKIKAELRRVFGAISSPARPVVTIIGGTDSVSQQTENALKAQGYETSRIAAADLATVDLPQDVVNIKRFYAVDLADAAGLAMVASYGPNNYGDGVVLFSQGGKLPSKAQALLNSVTGAATIIPLDAAGAQAASASWAGKPKGLTVGQTIGTNADRLKAFGGWVDGVVVVDRASATDLLIATSMAASNGYAVLAVDATAPLDPGVLAWLDAASGSVDRIVAVDTGKTLSEAVVKGVASAVSGQPGYTEAVS